jgi:hypothetical protein
MPGRKDERKEERKKQTNNGRKGGRKKERKKFKTRKNYQRLIHMTQTLTLYIYQWLLKFNWLVLNAPPLPKWLFSAPYFR